jgi:hypothetical protein
MRALLLICSFLLVACGKSPATLRERVASYGERQFCDDVLSYEARGTLPSAISEHFSPVQVRSYLTGVVLIYSESEGALSGIYVDREKVETVSGSGLSIEPWGARVGWLEEKKRIPIK